MKVGDLLKNKVHPDLGVGIIIELYRMKPGWRGIDHGCVAIFAHHGRKFVQRDCVEVISEGRQ